MSTPTTPVTTRGPMQIETSLTHVHRILLRAPEGEPFVLRRRASETTAACDTITIVVPAAPDGAVSRLQVEYHADGFKVREDGTVTKSKVRVEGFNLNSLPAPLLDTVLAVTDDLGITGLREDLDQVALPGTKVRLAAERAAQQDAR